MDVHKNCGEQQSNRSNKLWNSLSEWKRSVIKEYICRFILPCSAHTPDLWHTDREQRAAKTVFVKYEYVVGLT